MIQANELRVGNWVIMKLKHSNVGYVQEFHCVEPTTLMMLDGSIDSKNICFEPIPLTQDILLKCGFEKDIDDLILQIGNVILFISYSDDELVHCKNMALDTIVSIKHLHQLQNLYHSLTGSELNLQL